MRFFKRRIRKIIFWLLLLSCIGNSVSNFQEDNHSDAKAAIQTVIDDYTDNITDTGDNNEEESVEVQSLETSVVTTETYVIENNNIPYFTDEEKLNTTVFELYSDLDSLGRCGVAYANICQELMPTEERGEIGMIKPTGWHTVKYDCVDGNYLYNRCHLIGFQLAGENANEKNLITGTRWFNVQGMLPFENEVAEYVRRTNNHVLYRITPVYSGENLVVNGVRMEAWSVEDNGQGVCFCVFVNNIQPGIIINYATGESYESE